MHKKILVKGYFKRNLGDDLFLKVLTERYPERQFEVIVDAENAGYYSTFNNLHVIKRNFIFKALNKLLSLFSIGGIYSVLLYRYFAVIEIGGSIFPQPMKEPFIEKERMFLSNRIDHYFVIGSNFGPYSSKKFLDEYKNFFREIDGTVFRDKKSFSLFKKLDNVRYSPDVVLGMGNYNLKVNNTTQTRYAVISAIDLGFKDISRNTAITNKKVDYEKKLLNVILDLIDHGYEILFVPFSKTQNDLGVSAELKERIERLRPTSKISILKEDNIEKKVTVIKNSSLIISTRYHAMILGWLYNINQLVFIYSSKTRNVINDLFPEQYCYDLENNSSLKFEINKMNTINSKDINEI